MSILLLYDVIPAQEGIQEIAAYLGHQLLFLDRFYWLIPACARMTALGQATKDGL